MSKSIIKTALYSILPLFGLVGMIAGGCATIDQQDDDHIGATEQALTPEQCNYFAVNGKVQICHRTASTNKPYTILKISEQACVNAHAVHAGDYVAVNDPQCQGTGCLPADAPCDPTVPCCDGFSCVSGTCQANVSNHCDPSPCQNGGSCVNDTNGYTCDCPAGYTGSNCETEIDECASSPCQNGGTCLDGINAYVCECPAGYTGPTCADAVDLCASNPCANDGVCLPDGSSFFCYCQAGWEGPICTEALNPCDPNPCQNVGFCMPDGTSYSCTCQSGWTGPNCDTPIQSGYDCSANSNPCTPENINGGHFYFPATSSSNFVQCTEWGQCYVMPCMPGTVWNQSAETCVLP